MAVEAQERTAHAASIHGRARAGVIDPQHVGRALAVVRFMAAGAADGLAAICKSPQRHDAGRVAQSRVNHVSRIRGRPDRGFADRVIVGQIGAEQPAGQLLVSSAAAEAVNGNRAVMATQAKSAVGIDCSGVGCRSRPHTRCRSRSKACGSTAGHPPKRR